MDDLESNAIDQSWFSTARASLRLRPIHTTTASSQHHWAPNLDELDQSLDEANSQLRSLLDMTNHINLMTPLLPAGLSPVTRSHDFPDDTIRNKRRKIDSSRPVPSFKGFRYGKYGQVEPGQLQMEMVSCDGGMFSNESSYAAENILKDDNSVYCTKGNRCNIVLRHQGATVFTLQELTIKAPTSMSYSHPVREGMIFISMDQDDILSRTAQYQIQYPPSSHHGNWNSNDSSAASVSNSRQAERDPTPRHIISIRHHDDGTTSTRVHRSHPPHIFLHDSRQSQHGNRQTHQDEDAGPDHSLPEMPQEFTTNQPDFNITTECTSDEEEGYEVPHVLRRAPNRIGSLPFETETSDSEDTANPFSASELAEAFPQQIPQLPPMLAIQGPSHTVPHEREGERDHSSLSLSEAWEAHATATQEAVRAVGGTLLVPHARFFIEKKKSKCTIRFDPPVSGRFILLKMWSSHHTSHGNIDIQSVMAKGFAGPRFFPSVQLS